MRCTRSAAAEEFKKGAERFGWVDVDLFALGMFWAHPCHLDEILGEAC